ncbi:tetratricopeptide repeat protein [Ancylomarina sp. 16SWW S1-10-2]|uniref:tetratricopeptide repeat protein n=1 Tax=Ancylomarina sp. 16SWW S1-10-2 TaxID=2499681 RepID=UPI0012AE0583|nr:tetratricopeptide repeat protein [Ancylomarina sp. 16SWW S1-10-2]MRT92389.1 sel1 repeat family protein [Ancylomarina sp. 16SWW S1-10-2]
MKRINILFFFIMITISAFSQTKLDSIKRCAEQGSSRAQCNLAITYNNSAIDNNNSQNKAFCERQALYWFRKSAEQGNADAQFGLGLIYLQGRGVLLDKKEAVCWFKKSAEREDLSAQYRLGLMYSNGDGILTNKKKAAYWYKKSAEQGCIAAQFDLAIMYLNGDGILTNKKRAAYWIKKIYEETVDIKWKRIRAKKLWEKYELWKYE